MLMKYAEVIRTLVVLMAGILVLPTASISSELSGQNSAENSVQAEAVAKTGDSQEPGGKANTDTSSESTEDSQAGIDEETAKQAPSQSVQNPWTGAHGSFANFFNPFTMLNPAAYMGMMYPMMGMMGTMYNFPVDMMTQPWAMDMMMRSMNPHLLFAMFGHAGSAYKEGKVPEHLPAVRIPFFPTQNYQNWPKNKVSPGVSSEAKKNAFQTAMAFSPLSMRDMISIMTDKMPVQEDVSWDDAVEAMKLRANEVNFKFVGSSPLWKEIEAVTEKSSAKVEMFRFCDAAVARKILDEIPEFVIFLPCQISLIEDGEGKLWVMTMDWSIEWLDFAQNPNSHLAKNLRQDAIRIREAMTYIMEGAATGEF